MGPFGTVPPSGKIAIEARNKLEIAARPVLVLALLPILFHASLSESRPAIAHRQRAVTVDTILSCANDSLIVEVFKTDWRTSLKLDRLLMILTQHTMSSVEYASLRSKGFRTNLLDAGNVQILAADFASGRTIPKSKLEFCQDYPVAKYNKVDLDSFPQSIDVSGDGWQLNPNEVFAHADQFQFRSGVFSDSSDVFFIATKGPVAIQFICKPDGLKFYRAIYSPPE